jgi:tetratricopeptide (TPR) repeat protein
MKPSLILLLLAAACAAPQQSESATGARLYEGYGGYAREVTTASADAQHWFNQGLQLVYGFNHDEAIRSFREAAQLDPTCAMAWWGVAHANGIHVNNTQMSAAASAAGYEAAQEALRLSAHAAPVERALIAATARRYAAVAPDNRRSLDEAYAAGMEEAWRAFPKDADVGALFAESLMNLQPWDYWTADKQPKGRATEIVATLERVLRQNPAHPGANHFYIHAVEASSQPGRAEASADRLRTLVPGSGHLVHMPSHIYINVGRYDDAAAANEEAIAADEAYLKLAPPPDFYSIYYIHNVHFLAFAAMMTGRSALALETARKMEAEVPPEFLRSAAGMVDGMMPAALHALIRFGRWEEVLEEPDYPDWRFASRVMRRYARTVALANLGRLSEARQEFQEYDAAAALVPAGWSIGVNPAASILAVARCMAEGELLWREGRAEEAFALLREAVALEDALIYDEPPGWMQPVRHALGALLLADGRLDEAEKVYRADLLDNPRNAWSTLGLSQTLRAQGRNAEADAMAPELKLTWARADVEPPASCYCGVK